MVAQRQADYLIVGAVALAGLAVMLWITRRTSAGPAFRAIREDQILAASLGINTTYYKLLAFTLSAGFASPASPARFMPTTSSSSARRSAPRRRARW